MKQQGQFITPVSSAWGQKTGRPMWSSIFIIPASFSSYKVSIHETMMSRSQGCSVSAASISHSQISLSINNNTDLVEVLTCLLLCTVLQHFRSNFSFNRKWTTCYHGVTHYYQRPALWPAITKCHDLCPSFTNVVSKMSKLYFLHFLDVVRGQQGSSVKGF